MNFLELAEVLNSCLKLSAGLSFDVVVKYVDITCLLKPTISLMEASYHLDPPEYLTVATHEFLKVCLNISDETAKLAWATLRKLTWSFEAMPDLVPADNDNDNDIGEGSGVQGDDDAVIDRDGVCDEKPEAGNWTVCVRWQY